MRAVVIDGFRTREGGDADRPPFVVFPQGGSPGVAGTQYGISQQDRLRGAPGDTQREQFEFVDLFCIVREIIVGGTAFAVCSEVPVHTVLTAPDPVVTVAVKFLPQQIQSSVIGGRARAVEHLRLCIACPPESP